MPKAGRKNFGGFFFSEGPKKNAKTVKEFGIEGRIETFLHAYSITFWRENSNETFAVDFRFSNTVIPRN